MSLLLRVFGLKVELKLRPEQIHFTSLLLIKWFSTYSCSSISSSLRDAYLTISTHVVRSISLTFDLRSEPRRIARERRISKICTSTLSLQPK